MQRVGVIRTVARYPVKSMRGEAYASLPLTLQGFEEDRRFAFVQAESRSAFPWLTAREMPELLRWQTSVEKAGTADAAVTVTTPAGERWPVASNEIRQAIEKRFGKPVFLLRDYRGSFDVANVSNQSNFANVDLLRIGDKARIAVTEVDERCVMITLDPTTSQPAPQILKCVVQQHNKCAGVYATVLTSGEVRTGDGINLEH